MLTRRSFLQSALAVALNGGFAGNACGAASGQAGEELSLRPGEALADIPDDFIGLGYEMSSVAKAGLLSADNRVYVQLVRNLGSGGVLRAGGIVADFTSYSAAGAAAAEPKNTVLTRATLEQLRRYLDAIGWTAIWSVNFGRGTLEQAIVEAADVQRILGPRLHCIELGNEVENYGRGKNPLRASSYDYEAYRAEYSRWRAAILKAVPGLRFAAPDTASSVEWVEQMAADAHGDVQLLTTHYYRGDQKQGTVDQLMQADPDLEAKLQRLRQASKRSGLPWRMCETNSFFGGGRPGLSDTFAGALWTLDFMLLLAQYGCAGVNIETGVNQLGFISSYSPIQGDGAGHNLAGAPYYGMLAFAAATRDASTVVELKRNQRDAMLTAYALSRNGRIRSLVLINKAKDKSRSVSLRDLGWRRCSAMWLKAPSLESKTGVTLGGVAVEASGRWRGQPDRVLASSIVVPQESAVVLRGER